MHQHDSRLAARSAGGVDGVVTAASALEVRPAHGPDPAARALPIVPLAGGGFGPYCEVYCDAGAKPCGGACVPLAEDCGAGFADAYCASSMAS